MTPCDPISQGPCTRGDVMAAACGSDATHTPRPPSRPASRTHGACTAAVLLRHDGKPRCVGGPSALELPAATSAAHAHAQAHQMSLQFASLTMHKPHGQGSTHARLQAGRVPAQASCQAGTPEKKNE